MLGGDGFSGLQVMILSPLSPQSSLTPAVSVLAGCTALKTMELASFQEGREAAQSDHMPYGGKLSSFLGMYLIHKASWQNINFAIG